LNRFANSPCRRLLARVSELLALLAVGSVLLLSCSQGAQIVVINQADVPLREVVVSGSGFSQEVGTIQPNTQLRLWVQPRGESGLQVRFNARGKAVSFGPYGYFEGGGGYIVRVTISPTLAVSVKSELAY
jgi:hypothetical protein